VDWVEKWGEGWSAHLKHGVRQEQRVEDGQADDLDGIPVDGSVEREDKLEQTL
jgi:hypothetical protein